MDTLVRHNIAIAGACNSGKSTLLNAILNRPAALVSEVAGTTTDPVRHLVELPGAGACRFIDTPGADDTDSVLGKERISLAEKALSEADLILLTVGFNPEAEARIEAFARKHEKTLIRVATKVDEGNNAPADVAVSALSREGIGDLISQIAQKLAAVTPAPPFFGSLVRKGDRVVLVMPQDAEAPQERLILPQSRTIRELLNIGAIPVCCVTEDYPAALSSLKEPPALVITDSQAFGEVFSATPAGTPLTSFSILMANQKGDLRKMREGADKLLTFRNKKARILIAQACANIPKNEDIGRVKLPRMLRKTLGEQIQLEWCYGKNLPADLPDFDLVVHCGGCMFTRGHILSRIEEISSAGCSVTNYGLAIAACQGILPKIVLP